MEHGADWSLDELTRRVADALAVDDVRAPNGRIREVPDARAIRWYATIGLVDRPRFGPGRAARYGWRHLLQVVAVKRRQAQGRSLAEIQEELTGATDDVLALVAQLPDRDAAPAPARRERTGGGPVRDGGPVPDNGPVPNDGPLLVEAPRARFWAMPGPGARPPAPATPGIEAPTRPAPGIEAPTRPAAATVPAAPAAPGVSSRTAPRRGTPAPAVRYLVALSDTVTLSLPGAPTAGDLAAIHTAAAPLLDLLADRGLANPEGEPR